MAFLQYFMTVIAFGYFHIENICTLKKNVTPKEQQTNELPDTEI